MAVAVGASGQRASNNEIAAKVQSMYADALKKAKSQLKKGDLQGALSLMVDFFNHPEELAEYFHSRSVEDVKAEMLDRLEQARSALASIFAEYPERAKQFMSELKKIVEQEFDAFVAMKAEQAKHR